MAEGGPHPPAPPDTLAQPAAKPPRLVVASLISWLLPPVGGALGLFVWLSFTALSMGVPLADIAHTLSPMAFAKAVVFNVPTTFLIWLPIHRGFKAMGWQSPWIYALGFSLAPAALYLSLGTLLIGAQPQNIAEAWEGALPLLAAGIGAGLTLFVTLKPELRPEPRPGTTQE